MKFAITTILYAMIIGGVSYGIVKYLGRDHRYERWQELSNHEQDYMIRCVEDQPFFTCTENVHEMRQIGIIP